MLILPLEHLEPFAATLGVMLYPGRDEDDQRKAKIFPSIWLAKPLQRFHKAGYQLSYDILGQIAEHSGTLTDLDDRWDGGRAIGKVFKALYSLAQKHSALASWQNAILLYQICARREGKSSSRTRLYQYLNRFKTVAHLWGAFSIREGCFEGRPEAGYDGHDDFQCLLFEAEILRDFGQKWRRQQAKASPPLPPDVWRVPPGWKPPVRQFGWSATGTSPDLTLPGDLIAQLRPPGRPRKSKA
jgi:hypothetical protein